MRLGRALTPAALRAHLPRRTVRLRLALLYGGVFFISGVVLLALVYGAVARIHGAHTQVVGVPLLPQPNLVKTLKVRGPVLVTPPGLHVGTQRGSPHVTVAVVESHQRAVDLHVLALVSVLALAAMAAVSMGLGWLLAGRVLRPLRTITAAARDISATDLHKRLALKGPDDEFKELGDVFASVTKQLKAALPDSAFPNTHGRATRGGKAVPVVSILPRQCRLSFP